MKKARIELSEVQQAEAARAMLEAAFSALGKPPKNGDEDPEKTARRALGALLAAANAMKAEKTRFGASETVLVHVDTPPAHAMATAFWFWVQEVELDEDAVASSNAGQQMIGFAQALAAARATAEIRSILNDGEAFDLLGDRDYHTLATSFPARQG